MSKQLTMEQWCSLIERFASAVVNGDGLVKTQILNSGRTLCLDGGIVCKAQISLQSDEDDPEGLRYFPRVDVVSGSALCGDIDEVAACVRIYAAVCSAALHCRDSIRGIVVTRRRP